MRQPGDGTWMSTFDPSASHLEDWANTVTPCGRRSLCVGGVIGKPGDDAGMAKYLR